MGSTMDRYARCGTCRNVLHPYMFPYKNPDSNLPDPIKRTIKRLPASTYEKRLAAAEKARTVRKAEVSARRVAAQADGRDTTKCLLCIAAEEGGE